MTSVAHYQTKRRSAPEPHKHASFRDSSFTYFHDTCFSLLGFLFGRVGHLSALTILRVCRRCVRLSLLYLRWIFKIYLFVLHHFIAPRTLLTRLHRGPFTPFSFVITSLSCQRCATKPYRRQAEAFLYAV